MLLTPKFSAFAECPVLRGVGVRRFGWGSEVKMFVTDFSITLAGTLRAAPPRYGWVYPIHNRAKNARRRHRTGVLCRRKKNRLQLPVTHIPSLFAGIDYNTVEFNRASWWVVSQQLLSALATYPGVARHAFGFRKK